jgi:hypothetical protein
VVQDRDGQDELVVTVIQLSKPTMGFSFTVDMEAVRRLTRMRQAGRLSPGDRLHLHGAGGRAVPRCDEAAPRGRRRGQADIAQRVTAICALDL